MGISITPQLVRYFKGLSWTVGLVCVAAWLMIPSYAGAESGTVNNRQPARTVVGWLEFARIEEGSIRMKAKLDTGADNSSIHAKNIEKFSKEEVPWVRFTIVNEEGKEVVMEKEVVRTVRIRRHGGESLQRYVVSLEIVLGKVSKVVEVNLADREEFDIPLLIGRSFLAPEILVDSSMSYTVN